VTNLSVNPLNGGVERITQILSKLLKDKGYEVICLALNQKGYSDNNYGVPQYFFPSSNIFSLENVIYYNDFLSKNNIDIIINQVGNTKISYLFLNINSEIKKRIKIISVCHNKPLPNYSDNYRYILLPYKIETSINSIVKSIAKIILFPIRRFWFPKEELNFRKNLYSFVVNQSDKFVVLSSKYIPEIQSVTHYNNFEDKIVVIPNANTYCSDNEVCYEKRKQVLYVGRFDPSQKRPDLLLKIWKIIYKNHPDWELIFVGTGPMESQMNSYVKRHRLKRVYFKGAIDPLEYYHKASIIALTSMFEGFPMVLTEAMQNEVVPILFDSFGAASDVVIHDKTGLLVTPYDINEFALKLSELMQNETLRYKLSKSAFEYVKKFDIQNIIIEWEKLIKSINY